MPKGIDDYLFLFLATCDYTNFTIVVPLKTRQSSEVASALQNRVCHIFGPPDTLIVDEDKALTSKVILLLLQFMKIHLFTISPYNHGSSKAERQIQSISNILTKHLKDKGEEWPNYCSSASAANNFFKSTALNDFSPYELVFLRNNPTLFPQPVDLQKHADVTLQEYYDNLMEHKAFIDSIFESFRTKQALDRHLATRQFQKQVQFQPGDLVGLYAPHASSLQTSTRKFRRDWIGPLAITTAHGNDSYSLKDIATQKELTSIYPVHRLKRWFELSPHNTLITNQDELLRANDSLPPS